MSTIEHDLDCECGQPLDVAVTSASRHCPRCGQTLAAPDGRVGGHSAATLSTAVVATGFAA